MAVAWLLVLLCLFPAAALATTVADGEAVGTVRLALGRVSGQHCPAHPGVVRYMGIPFGLPTRGPRRFRPPVPYGTPYPYGELRAVTVPPACPQKDYPSAENSSEDCLYLNVWAPPVNLSRGLLPVRVWIHGGAFSYGSASEPNYDGCATVSESDTIQVNLQYRLGALGFMAHPAAKQETGFAGNWGLLDQQLGLKWVRDNIMAFGGDPNRVMIFGESAGGMSVGFQLVSPLSAGLFHSAIEQSGAPFRIQTVHEAYIASSALSLRLQCTDRSPRANLWCLRMRSVQQILAAEPFRIPLYNPHFPTQIFFPVVDGVVIPKQPLAAIAAGEFNKVPLLMGTNRDEGVGFAHWQAAATGRNGGLTQLDLREFASVVFPNARYSDILDLYTGKDYPGSRFPCESALADLFTDSFFRCPTVWALDEAAKWGVPTFQYLWSHSPSWQSSNEAEHFSEVVFMFGNAPTGITESERQISADFSRAWAAMARSGSPVLPGNATWPQWSTTSQRLVTIGDAFESVDFDLATKCDKLNHFAALKDPRRKWQRKVGEGAVAKEGEAALKSVLTDLTKSSDVRHAGKAGVFSET